MFALPSQVRESKRARTQTAQFQSPSPEIMKIIKDIQKNETPKPDTPPPPDGKDAVFFR